MFGCCVEIDGGIPLLAVFLNGGRESMLLVLFRSSAGQARAKPDPVK